MTKLNIVNEARGHLLEYGWTRGTFGAKGSSTCLIGAFTRTGIRFNGPLVTEIFEDLKELIGPIITWNDRPGRTFNEVMDVMDELILKIKEEEREEV